MAYYSGNEETELERRHREHAAKIALERREWEEAAGLCKCSDERGNLLRLSEDGCPRHNKRRIVRLGEKKTYGKK